MKLCGVVIWYNPKREELENIKSYIHAVDKLFIIDNSSNNNQELLDEIKKNSFEYIYNGENLGIARALNIGCEKAINQGYEWILTMDQDSKFQVGMIEKYILNVEDMISKNSDIAIFAPISSENINEESGYVNKIITSGSILNLNYCHNIGGFDDELFIDEVDFDMCFRLLENGFKLYKFNDIFLNHSLGNMKKIKILNWSFFAMNHNYIRKYYMIRNTCLIKKRHPQYTSSYTKDNIKNLIKVILVEDDKFRKIKYMFKGYIDYKTNKFGKL